MRGQDNPTSQAKGGAATKAKARRPTYAPGDAVGLWRVVEYAGKRRREDLWITCCRKCGYRYHARTAARIKQLAGSNKCPHCPRGGMIIDPTLYLQWITTR